MAKAKKTYVKQQPAKVKEERKKSPLLLSPYLLLFIAVWAWAAFWYGDVFRIARERSFWVADDVLMGYYNGRPWEELWRIGLFLLQFYRWPMVGALITSLFVTGSTYMLAYCLKLRGWWRLIQYLPAMAYLAVMAYLAFDIYFEAETGMIMGIPFLSFLVLLIMTVIIRTFSKHSIPNIMKVRAGASVALNRVELLMALLTVGVSMAITQWMRPYMRVIPKMERLDMEQRWAEAAQMGRDNGDLSYRALAAYYTVALLQRGEIGTRLFDIRMDYDDPYMHGFDKTTNTIFNYYLMDMDFHNGLIQTAIHHAMEQMTMNGPNIKALKMLTKCALLTGEWEVAERYFTVMKKVPFEGDWVAKYEPMLRDTVKINADPEFKMVRLTEPMRDVFENVFVQPTFLGYNASLLEGRTINALWNSLAVHAYTKSMEPFVYRCTPMQGTTPPESFAQALALMASKHPEVMKMYPGLQFQQDRLTHFVQDVKPLMGDRPGHARELYKKYKGYYPYYYFFGNLKATKKTSTDGSSNSGVN